MTVLTGTPQEKREISERLARFRQHPDRTLTLSETHPTLTFQALDVGEGAAPPLASNVRAPVGVKRQGQERRIHRRPFLAASRLRCADRIWSKLVRGVRFGYAFRSTEA